MSATAADTATGPDAKGRRRMKPPLSRDLFILAFDHRGSIERDLLKLPGKPTPADQELIRSLKAVIFEGSRIAWERTRTGEVAILVDERYGSTAIARAKEVGIPLAVGVEKSGQAVFDFEYGDAFAEHIDRTDPEYVKALVRYNPADGDELKATQLARLKVLSDAVEERPARLLLELLVPSAAGMNETDPVAFAERERPALVAHSIAEFQTAGIEADIWKLEGINTSEDCAHVVQQAQAGGRDSVACVILGAGASAETVDSWLRAAAPVDGFRGFAIGRSIWWTEIGDYIAGRLDAGSAAARIAENFDRFVTVYTGAAAS
jgi:myo-inositol catabolism protein IolC